MVKNSTGTVNEIPVYHRIIKLLMALDISRYSGISWHYGVRYMKLNVRSNSLLDLCSISSCFIVRLTVLTKN